MYYRWYYGLLALIIFSLGTLVRFYRLNAIKGYYFDEVYHVPTAKMMAKHDQRAYEWQERPSPRDVERRRGCGPLDDRRAPIGRSHRRLHHARGRRSLRLETNRRPRNIKHTGRIKL